jgi:hypothetical protein
LSAYTANGSFIDVAKIEAGEVYNAFMLDELQPPSLIQTTIVIYCPLPHQLCQYWPIQRELSMRPPNSLAPVLKALVSAAEAALKTEVRSAMVSAHGLEELATTYSHAHSAFD